MLRQPNPRGLRGEAQGPSHIKAFWDNGVLVCKAAGCFGFPFKAGRSVAQGGPVSPTIFNLMVDAIIREWEQLLIIRRIPLGQIRTLIAVFHTDNRLIASRNPKTLQTAVDLLIGLFDRVGLQTNNTKTEVMVFVPGKIRTLLSEMAYCARMNKHFRNKGKSRKVEYGECGKELAVGSLADHMATQHDIYQLFVMEVEGDGTAAVRTVGRNIRPGGELLPLPRAGLPARA